jgi:hypothetical protein
MAKDYSAAERHLVKGLEDLQGSRGAEHPRTQEALQSVVTLYERWGKQAEAARYRAMLTPPNLAP